MRSGCNRSYASLMAVRTEAIQRPGTRLNPGLGALLVAVGIWGFSYVVADPIVNQVGPFTLGFFRFVLSFAILIPFAWRRGYRFRLSTSKVFLLFGFTGMVLHLGLENAGLFFTSPGNAALIIATVPAVTLALSIIFLKERMTFWRGVGIGLSIAGVVLLTAARAGSTSLLDGFGVLLVFAGVVAWGVYTVQGKRMAVTQNALVATTAGTGAALLMQTPLAIGEVALRGLPTLDTGAWLGIAYLGVLASAAAFALWNHSLQHMEASTAGAFVNLVPVIGVIAAVMLGETIGGSQWAGAGIVAAGVWLTQKGDTR